MLTFKAPYRDRYGMVSIQSVVKIGEARGVDCGSLWREGETTTVRGWGDHDGERIVVRCANGGGAFLLTEAQCAAMGVDVDQAAEA